jgi:hypothetical protein
VKKGSSHKKSLLKEDIIAPRPPIHAGNMRFCRETSLGRCSYLDPNIHDTLKPRRGYPTPYHVHTHLRRNQNRCRPENSRKPHETIHPKTTPISGGRVGCNTAGSGDISRKPNIFWLYAYVEIPNKK